MQNKPKFDDLNFYQIKKQNLWDDGYVVVTEEDIPFSSQEWLDIKDIIAKLKYETDAYGDSGEPMELEYFRIKESYKPQIYHERLWELLTSEKIFCLYKGLTGLQDPYLDRCQIHKLKEAGYLGRHYDIAQHPQYQYTFIFFLEDDYDGGELLFYKEETPIPLRPKARSLVVNCSRIAHEISLVKRGTRTTLCCFFSEGKPLPKAAQA